MQISHFRPVSALPPVRAWAIGAASLLAIIAFGGGAFAADISLKNVRVTPPNGKSNIVMPSVSVLGTNLTRDEVSKLFSTSVSKDERLAITSKMQASAISIPQVTITRIGEETGEIVVTNFAAKSVNKGKFEKLSFQALRGDIPDKKLGGSVTVSSGPMVLEDGDISKMFAALKAGDITNGTSRFGKFSWSNFQVRVPEKTPSGPAFHTVKIGSIVGEAKYDGDVPTKTFGEAKGIVYMPAANSKAGQGMAAFGYKQVNVGFVFDGVYDPKSKTYSLNEYTIKGPDTGAITIKARFGNIDKAAFTGDKRQRMGSLMQGDVDQVSVKFVNTGVFDKGIAFYGRMIGKQPAQVRQQWAGMVGGMLPMVLGGDSSAMQVASSVSDFVKNAKNILVSISGKAGPLQFKDLTRMGDPMSLVSKLNISAAANK